MNIFYLDENPVMCAFYHCDKHVVKMILETAQLLSTAHRVLDDSEDERLYKATHINHPSAIWVRQSKRNYNWAFDLFLHLCQQYTKRYNKIHKSASMIPLLSSAPNNIPIGDFTDPPLCMPDEYKIDIDPVKCYRAYYIGDKANFAKWKSGNVPTWFERKEDV